MVEYVGGSIPYGSGWWWGLVLFWPARRWWTEDAQIRWNRMNLILFVFWSAQFYQLEWIEGILIMYICGEYTWWWFGDWQPLPCKRPRHVTMPNSPCPKWCWEYMISHHREWTGNDSCHIAELLLSVDDVTMKCIYIYTTSDIPTIDFQLRRLNLRYSWSNPKCPLPLSPVQQVVSHPIRVDNN